VIFSLDPGSPTYKYTRMYSTECTPDSCAKGYQPVTGLVQDANGYLYGGTNSGGTLGGGAIYSLGPNGSDSRPTVIYNICVDYTKCPEGGVLREPMIVDAQFRLFGVMEQGGVNGGGTVFKLRP
jgi:hypothetical protein